jgi:hypothetical protein
MDNMGYLKKGLQPYYHAPLATQQDLSQISELRMASQLSGRVDI